jgi:hypothetical protein
LSTKEYWLDLELREDIDDYATLVYALEQGMSIHAVSIHNPSKSELKILSKTLNFFDVDTKIVVAGQITEYPEGKDIHASLMEKITDTPLPEITHLITTLLTFEDKPTPTVFCGGSLYTLSQLLKYNPDKKWQACIQGGYAGPSIVGVDNSLKKFKKRDKVPTWNLNLDLESTKSVLKSDNLEASFVSKNVCHDSWVDQKDISSADCLFNQTLKDYFENNAWSNKCMHDLLAFMTLTDDKLVSFLPVTLNHTEDERPKWFSVENAQSNTQISIGFDKPRFIESIQGYSPKHASLKHEHKEISPCDDAATVSNTPRR